MRLLLAVTGCALSGSAIADTVSLPDSLAVDFRSSAWAGAEGHSAHSVGGVTARPGTMFSELTHDSEFGMGIDGPFGSNGDVDGFELLIVEGLTDVTGVWLTGFDAGATGELEFALLTGGSHIVVIGSGPGGIGEPDGNGNYFVDFGGPLSGTFTASTLSPHHDFRLAGFTAFNTVPLVAPSIMVAAGLVPVAGRRQRRSF